jgi:hypothetical protein
VDKWNVSLVLDDYLGATAGTFDKQLTYKGCAACVGSVCTPPAGSDCLYQVP